MSQEGTFYAHLAVEKDPDKASGRAKRDAALCPEMKRVWEDNLSVYGARKLWHAMKREKFDIARCTPFRAYKDALPGSEQPVSVDQIHRTTG